MFHRLKMQKMLRKYAFFRPADRKRQLRGKKDVFCLRFRFSTASENAAACPLPMRAVHGISTASGHIAADLRPTEALKTAKNCDLQD